MVRATGRPVDDASEIPCRVSELPCTEATPCEDPLITVKPSPAASIKDEATAGG